MTEKKITLSVIKADVGHTSVHPALIHVATVELQEAKSSRLLTDFSNHVLDATNAWDLVLTDEADLAGLPQSARAQARAAAQARGVTGWRFTLHQPRVSHPYFQADGVIARDAEHIGRVKVE